jgi:hypothetical protein
VAEDGNRLTVASDSGWVPLSEPVNGPLFLRINRAPSADRRPVPFPRAEHHALHCGHLVSDLFESVPADWSWIEGHCRMAARWACQNQWNFLACSGTGIPFMVSKRRYGGDQTHEYFMSMRPVTPSDSGDVSFHYDPTQDEKLQVFHEHRGWYNRRDLNFSFCSDGRNPLSGYAVVFGGEDNSVTRFYRQGKVLEQTESATFLFPPGPGHQDIHWRWWKMTIHKRGGHIRVLMDGRTLFDVVDPEPLPDGFVGFWTVRNGFSLAKVSSQAESIAWEPDVLYVDQDRGESPWHPLLTDSMALAPGTDGMTQVRLMVGGGFGALRYTCPAPVSLAESPQLRLPIRASDDIALTAFLETTAGDFLLDLGAGTAGMKSLATPSGEAGECFQLPTLTAEQLAAKVLAFTGSKDDAIVCDVRAELAKHGVQTDGVNVLSITLGRTANPGYALAGADGRNLAGTGYQVGEPVFGPSEAK